MGDDEDTTVTQNNHATNTLAAIHKLYRCHQLCDMTLLMSDNVTLSVHRVVLVASSEYFKSCLGSDEGKHFESIPYISSLAMNNLLDFMYTGTLSLNQSNAWLLLAAATQLQVSAVIELCQNFLKQKSVGKDNSEATGHHMCPIGFPCDMEDITVAVNGDDEDRVSPVGCNVDSETTGTMKHAVDSNKAVTQVPVETETTVEYLDGMCWSDFDDVKTESAAAAPSVGTPEKHAAACVQTTRKAEHSGKRKSVSRKTVVMCKFCMKEFRYCSARKLHIRLNHTHLTNFLQLDFSWHFRKDSIPEPIQTLLPGGAIQHGCIACNEQFSLRSFYHAHFCSAHRVNLKCKTCGKMLQTRKLLMIHRAFSHKMAPAVGRLLCGECRQPFIHRRVFESHQCRRNLHVEGRKRKTTRRKSLKYVYDKSKFRLVCPFCSQNFCYRKSFMNHIAAHTGGKVPGKLSNELHRKCGKSNTKHQEFDKETRDHFSPVVKRKRRTVVTRRKFKCEEGCPLVLPSYAALRQHMKQQHPLVVFQCNQCRYHTSVGRMMAKHTRLKHSNDREKKCDICGKEFSKPSHCKIHKYMKHDVYDPSVKVYHCDVPGCKYRTCQTANLRVHKKNHDNDTSFVCSTCGKKLKTELTLEKHIQKVHLNVRPFICEKCGQAYGEERELDLHLAGHESEKRYQCDQCDYATQVKVNFHSHMFAMHKVTASGQKIFRCSVCDYATDRRGRMRDHEICHLGIRNFCCTQCDKRFMTRPTLNEHVRCMHTPKTLRCNLCSYVSSTRRHLVEHTRVMHTYRQLRPYQCVYCDYHSSISGNCRKHCKSKHRGMPVKWVKVGDTDPKYSSSLAVPPGGEYVQPGGDAEQAGVFGHTVQPDIHNTDVSTSTSTKVYLPAAVQNTLAVSQPDFVSIGFNMSHDQPVPCSYDALNPAYTTGQFFS